MSTLGKTAHVAKTTYRIQDVTFPRRNCCVHFNRLKAYSECEHQAPNHESLNTPPPEAIFRTATLLATLLTVPHFWTKNLFRWNIYIFNLCLWDLSLHSSTWKLIRRPLPLALFLTHLYNLPGSSQCKVSVHQNTPKGNKYHQTTTIMVPGAHFRGGEELCGNRVDNTIIMF